MLQRAFGILGCVALAGSMSLGAAPAAFAQALNPDFVHGRDYTFERVVAERAVDDADDKGTVRLVAYVYRPVRNDRREVVLFSHGSTGGLVRAPSEPAAPPPSLVRFFVSRGYTFVAPSRRGRGESSGTYVEECAFYLGKCTLAEQAGHTERTVREAVADSNAVIDQVILGRLAPRGAGIVLAGVSRGGFLSLVLAGERPGLVKGVVNFVGGWHSVSERYPAADNQLRTDAQTKVLSHAGARAKAPTIWVYAARDPFYTEATSRGGFFQAWRAAGGQGEYHFVAEHSLAIGHEVASDASLWGARVDAFLKALDSPARPQ